MFNYVICETGIDCTNGALNQITSFKTREEAIAVKNQWNKEYGWNHFFIVPEVITGTRRLTVMPEASDDELPF